MSERISPSSSERRSFLTRLSTGVAAFAAAMAGGAASGYAQSSSGASWQPERHEKDDWLDKIPAKHRMIFDTTSADGLGDALAFTNNSDLAVIIVMRHRSTGFAYNDAIWAKYGVQMSKRANFVDPKTKEAAKINLLNVAKYDVELPNRGNTVDALVKQGVHLAVCSVATRGIATAVAEATGGNADNIFTELVSNLLSTTAHMVPAGIVAVNRAQEHGYTLVTA